MAYTTLLFDADGTLFDFARAERTAILQLLTAFDLPADPETAAGYSRINDDHWKMLERGEIEKSVLLHRRFAVLCEQLGVQRDPYAMAQRYSDLLCGYAFLMPEAEEVCCRLAEKYRMYIVTNGTAVVQRARFAASPLMVYFADRFISEEIGCEKPGRAYFDYVALHIPNFCREETLLIGDSPTSDMRGGATAGIDTCWYAPQPVPLPADVKPTYTIRKLTDLYGMLLKQ